MKDCTLAFAKNLRVLGIEMKIQRVDLSQYVNRIKSYDFDMIVGVIGTNRLSRVMSNAFILVL